MKWTSIEVAPLTMREEEGFYIRLPHNPTNIRIIWSEDLADKIKSLEKISSSERRPYEQF